MMWEGQQLRLRDWKLEDLELYAYWLQPHHRWNELDAPYYAKHTANEIVTTVERVRQKIETRKPDEFQSRYVIAERATDELIGMVSWYWQSEETLWADLGIVIYDSAWWEQGKGCEAFGLWTQGVFENMPQLVRLGLRTWSGNAGMMRLTQKLGYVEEARFRKARIVKGEYYDGMGYGVLRDEWQQRHPNGFAHTINIASPNEKKR